MVRSVRGVIGSVIHQSVEDESDNGLLGKMRDEGINTRFLRFVSALVYEDFTVSPSSLRVRLPLTTGENDFYDFVGFGKCVDTLDRPVCVDAQKGLW